MRTLYIYLLLLCFTSLLGRAQFTLVPDPNFEDFLESNGMGDGVPGNGQVLTANIENVTGIGPSGRGIQDLTGIEDFAALEILDCSVNPITFLDVSQNTQLTALACWSNAISTLIIGNQPNLTYLDAHENFLSQIDISLCPSLETVYLEINSLSNLDITQCPNIDLLYVDNNNLSALDISENVVLTDLIASHNNIDSLDASQNTNLSAFLVSNNPFTYLDVRNGANEDINAFVARETPLLDCIYVDDSSADYLEDWIKDEEVNFAENEAECLLGNDDNIGQPYTLFPNPVDSYLVLESSEEGRYVLYDLQGKRLIEGAIRMGRNLVDMSFLSKGSYFLMIVGEESTSQEQIIKH